MLRDVHSVALRLAGAERQILAHMRMCIAFSAATLLPPLRVSPAPGSSCMQVLCCACGPHQVGVDWTVDMADARARLGKDVSLQGNVDPTILFASKVSRS